MEINKRIEHIGGRVAAARRSSGMNQEELSARLGFKDRQILSNIESGKRALSPEELIKLVETTGHDLDFFIDPYRLAGEGAFSFRAEKADAETLDAFEDQAGRWMALYRRLSRLEQETDSVVTPYTATLKLSHDSSYVEAEDAAEWLGTKWNLGPVPSKTLVQTAAKELRLLVLYVDAPEGISGAACRLKDLDTILINRNDNTRRRNFDFAHELFHLLTWDRMPPGRIDVNKPRASKAKRMERLANAFASRLLFPKEEIKHQWEARDPNRPLVDTLKDLAGHFGSSSQAVFWRLVFDELLEKDTIGDYTTLQDPDGEPPPLVFSDPFIRTLHHGLDRGLISARKAAKVMGLSLEELAQLFDERRLHRPYDL